MKASAFLVAVCVASAPVYAHHGPFELKNEGQNHGLHLGSVSTPNQGQTTGKNHFSVRACYLDELDFVRSGFEPRNRKTIPFKLKTDKVVAFGLAGEGNTGFNAGNAGAVAISGLLTLNPFAIPVALLSSGGQRLWQYSIVSINPENGRLAQRIMTLYSEKDVRYANDYLHLATGLNPNEQMREDEIKALVAKVMEGEPIESTQDRVDCPYIEKFGKPLPPKKVRKPGDFNSGRSRGI